MWPGVTFRVFKGCAKCGLRLRSVCLRGVQNAACGFVRCVSFTSRCPAPSVLHVHLTSYPCVFWCLFLRVKKAEMGSTILLFVKCSDRDGLVTHVCVSVTWRSSTSCSGLMPISTGRFALLPSGDEASNLKRCWYKAVLRTETREVCAPIVACPSGRWQSGQCTSSWNWNSREQPDCKWVLKGLTD
jgi:hypothetical protein